MLVALLRAVEGARAGVDRTTISTRDGRLWPIRVAAPLRGRDLGVPVVLLHGFGNDGSTWVPFMRELAATRPVIAPDLPGFGRHALGDAVAATPSMYSAALASLLTELTISWGQPPVVIGKSMGAMVGGLVAAARPDLVRALMLIAPAGIRTPRISPFWEAWAADGTNLLLPRDASMWHEMLRVLYYRPVRVPGFLRRTALATIRSQADHLHRLFDELLAEGYNPLGDRLDAIRCPVTVVWGAFDSIMDASGVDVVRQALPAADIRIVPACGHSPTRERPDEVRRALTSLLLRFG